ncbi:MAG: 3-phosphoglycerate dehydrogenase [Oscillospiraceae bacterium]|jgi:D-3-phosphoglycerate dehydrogenase|nr:3-phosphoglycerate dehydrogenase [Oscillospiraceae bacterium]
MYKVQTLNKIAKIGLDVLAEGDYTVGDAVENPDAILVRSAKMHDMTFGSKLLCVARAGAGTNNIPSDRCAEEAIVVFNTPGANSDAVKELVLCALLISSRDVIGGIDWVHSIAENGDEIPALVEAGKNAFTGPELSGKTLGVVGLGAIGAKIANDAARLGMKVYGYDPYLSVDAAWRLRTNIRHAKDLQTIYRNCDYITIHVPYMDSTHHLINTEALSVMRPGVRIINLARAELVCDDDILSAIDSGKVACYVTDFPNAKTAGAKGVIAIPHLGASTPESEEKCALMAAEEIRDYLENGNIANSVNMPYASMPRVPGSSRLCVFHRNKPDMIAQITRVISAHGLNIENMHNAGVRGHDMAYTMIDLPFAGEKLTEDIRALDDIVRVRLLG